MNFVRDKMFEKKAFGDILLLPDGSVKEESMNDRIWPTESRILYICIYIYKDIIFMDTINIRLI